MLRSKATDLDRKCYGLADSDDLDSPVGEAGGASVVVGGAVAGAEVAGACAAGAAFSPSVDLVSAALPRAGVSSDDAAPLLPPNSRLPSLALAGGVACPRRDRLKPLTS